jgi:hypothetical protein
LRLDREENVVKRSRPIEKQEKRANVVVQIVNVIPAIMVRDGTTALGPPAATRTGKDVRTITTLRRADLRTIRRKRDAGNSSSSPRMINGLGVGGSIVISLMGRASWSAIPHIIGRPIPVGHQPYGSCTT